jgi:hypothetical protein
LLYIYSRLTYRKDRRLIHGERVLRLSHKGVPSLSPNTKPKYVIAAARTTNLATKKLKLEQGHRNSGFKLAMMLMVTPGGLKFRENLRSLKPLPLAEVLSDGKRMSWHPIT